MNPNRINCPLKLSFRPQGGICCLPAALRRQPEQIPLRLKPGRNDNSSKGSPSTLTSPLSIQFTARDTMPDAQEAIPEEDDHHQPFSANDRSDPASYRFAPLHRARARSSSIGHAIPVLHRAWHADAAGARRQQTGKRPRGRGLAQWQRLGIPHFRCRHLSD